MLARAASFLLRGLPLFDHHHLSVGLPRGNLPAPGGLMATILSTSTAGTATSGNRDRIFYTGMAIAMALTVFVGFARTYYLRGYFGPATSVTGGTELGPLVHLHGILFTAWILLFIVQTGLIAARRAAVHRRLGLAGALLAVAMVVVGTKTAIAAAARGSAPPGLDPLVFLVVPLFDMLLFASFVAMALRRRRDKEAHKRLMLLAYVSIIVAGVARIPGVITLGPLGFFALSFLFAVVGMTYDRHSRGRVHPVYKWGMAVLVLSVPVRLALSSTSAWRSFAASLMN
jgi:hypothetical protein